MARDTLAPTFGTSVDPQNVFMVMQSSSAQPDGAQAGVCRCFLCLRTLTFWETAVDYLLKDTLLWLKNY